ncbi:MAG: poly-gamma-glutamate biosynthesis protein PgsC [Acidobacteriota bacterium]
MILETLITGLLVALLFSEIFNIYPGGLIVPVYFAYYLDQPEKCLATLVISFLSLFCYRLFENYLILFGKRRFIMFLLLGIFWGVLFSLFAPKYFPVDPEFKAIGWIIPGLLANNLSRQKILPTLISLVSVSSITFALVRLLFGIG